MPKITLAVIAGNVAHYIRRFIESFKPLVDEIVIVEAVGNQASDGTLQIAKEMGCKTAVYRNDPAHDWPHVDDFAAARNLAFSLASNEWVMWADTDDTINAENVAKLRNAVENAAPDTVAIAAKYNVPEDGLCVYRERIVRRGHGKWIYPIHETLDFSDEEKTHILRCDAVIEHMPDLKRGRVPNDERNARILESMDDKTRTVAHSFHLFQSLRALGRIGESVKIATDLLTQTKEEIEAPERYELLIALAQLNNDPAQRAQLLLQAIGTCPERREAYGEIALAEIGLNRAQSMLGWTTAMMALPKPDGYLWNYRSKYYGWCGVNIHAMALRANGQSYKADTLETNHFKKNGGLFSLLHATRGRPALADKARMLWFKRADNPDAIEHIFAFDADDELSNALSLYRHIIPYRQDGASVGAWNAAASIASGKILVQLNDDFIPPMHWDTMLLEAFGDKLNEPAALHVSDGHRTDDLLCLCIINRARYKQQGFFLHPRFKSVYSDNYHSWLAYRDGVVIDAKHITIEHDHPYFKGGEGWDETYAKHNAPERYAEGAAIYEQLTGCKA